jgi:hypothetical protein
VSSGETACRRITCRFQESTGGHVLSRVGVYGLRQNVAPHMLKGRLHPDNKRRDVGATRAHPRSGVGAAREPPLRVRRTTVRPRN